MDEMHTPEAIRPERFLRRRMSSASLVLERLSIDNWSGIHDHTSSANSQIVRSLRLFSVLYLYGNETLPSLSHVVYTVPYRVTANRLSNRPIYLSDLFSAAFLDIISVCEFYFVVTFAQLMLHMRILHYVIPCFGIVLTNLSSVDPTNTSPKSTTAKIGQNLERPCGAGWYSRMTGKAMARMMVMV